MSRLLTSFSLFQNPDIDPEAHLITKLEIYSQLQLRSYLRGLTKSSFIELLLHKPAHVDNGKIRYKE